jgi:hypothetical protein
VAVEFEKWVRFGGKRGEGKELEWGKINVSALHVLTSGGNRYRVASADHANLNPKGSALSF